MEYIDKHHYQLMHVQRCKLEFFVLHNYQRRMVSTNGIPLPDCQCQPLYTLMLFRPQLQLRYWKPLLMLFLVGAIHQQQ
uniref:Ovule protein n=1 Tax=Brugia timori TaxID=42155 RepID=A0A0R3QFQ2_9BILA